MALQFVTAQIKDSAIVAAKLDLTGSQTYNFGQGSTVLQYKLPTTSAEVATKGYVDSIAQGLYWKDPVVAASESSIAGAYNNGASGVGATLTNNGSQAALVVDGINVQDGDRILVKAQTDAKQNGIYVVTDKGSNSSNYVLTRAVDFDQSAEIPAAAVFVVAGTVNDNLGYVCTNDDPPNIGTATINFVQFTGTGAIVAGQGIQKVGNKLQVQLSALAGLTFSGAGDNATLELDVKTNFGLALDGGELKVDFDNTTIGIVSNKLAVKSDGIGLAQFAGRFNFDSFNTAGATLFTLSSDIPLANFRTAGNIRVYRNGQRLNASAAMNNAMPDGSYFIFRDGSATKVAIKTALAAGEFLSADYLR